MQARFADLKSAALACEQLLVVGYPREKLSLVDDAHESDASVEHISVLDRLRGLLSLSRRATSPNASNQLHEAHSKPTHEVALLLQDPTLTPEAREIIRQYGGWLYADRDHP